MALVNVVVLARDPEIPEETRWTYEVESPADDMRRRELYESLVRRRFSDAVLQSVDGREMQFGAGRRLVMVCELVRPALAAAATSQDQLFAA